MNSGKRLRDIRKTKTMTHLIAELSTWKLRGAKDNIVSQYLNAQAWKAEGDHEHFSHMKSVVYNHSLKLSNIFLSNFTWNQVHGKWQSLLSSNKQRLLCNHSVSSHQATSTWYRSMQSSRNSSVGYVFCDQSCSTQCAARQLKQTAI